MTENFVYSKRKKIWVNILFFGAVTIGAVVFAPLYAIKHGFSAFDWGLFGFFAAATGLSITAGYHRLFSHAAYKAHPLVRFFFLFFGAAAFEQSAYYWCIQHRDHHRYVDTERDPYNIKKGFWYAHMEWLLFWEHHIDDGNIEDLKKDKVFMNQHKYYLVWSIGAGILLPWLIGVAAGHGTAAAVLAVCARLTLVHHSTFFINSVCHMFGKATYDVYSTAKDHWLVAFLTYGEGYHNFHHRFPSDYRNAVLWYQWDPSKWLIAALSKIGLTRELRRVSRFKILDARIMAENRRLQDSLLALKDTPKRFKVGEEVKGQFMKLRRNLTNWEAAVKEYQTLLQQQMTKHSEHLQHTAAVRVRAARKQFKLAYEQWGELIKHNPIDLERNLALAS